MLVDVLEDVKVDSVELVDSVVDEESLVAVVPVISAAVAAASVVAASSCAEDIRDIARMSRKTRGANRGRSRRRLIAGPGTIIIVVCLALVQMSDVDADKRTCIVNSI